MSLLLTFLVEVVGSLSRSATRNNNTLGHDNDERDGKMNLKATRCRSSAARHRQLGIRLVDQPITFPSTLSSRHQPTTTNESIKRTNEYCIELNSEIFTRCLALLFKMTLMTLMWLMLMEEEVVVDEPSISSIPRFLREIETSDPLLIPIECCVEFHVDVRCVS